MSAPPLSLSGAPASVDGFVQVAADMTGKLIDNSQVTSRAGYTVYRQRTVMVDDMDPDAMARVLCEEPGRTDYGLCVRVIPGPAERETNELLLRILQQLRFLTGGTNKLQGDNDDGSH